MQHIRHGYIPRVPRTHLQRDHGGDGGGQRHLDQGLPGQMPPSGQLPEGVSAHEPGNV